MSWDLSVLLNYRAMFIFFNWEARIARFPRKCEQRKCELQVGKLK